MHGKQVFAQSRDNQTGTRCFSLFDKAGMGILIAEPEDTIVDCNSLFLQMFGYLEGELNGRKVSELISPKDTPLKKDPYLSLGTKGSDCYKTEKRCLRKDGQTFWCKLTVCLFQENHSPTQDVLFLFEDITDRKRSEEALAESEEKYRDLFENANDLIQCVAPDGHFVYVNRAWRETLGYGDLEIGQLTVFDILSPDCIDHCSEVFRKLMIGEMVERVEVTFLTKYGKKIIVEGSLNTRFADGKPVSTRGIFRDITERKQHEARLQYLSTHDALTGLYNRAIFDETMRKLEGSDLSPITIVMGDVVGLKRVNDRFGHAAGDELLRDAARLLKEVFVNSTLIARIGGDEFAILLPGVNKAVVRQQIARIRQELQAKKCSQDIPVLSISLGSAMGLPGDGLEVVLKRADKDMYEQKGLYSPSNAFVGKVPEAIFDNPIYLKK